MDFIKDYFPITGMACELCAETIKNGLQNLNGVSEVDVLFGAKLLVVIYDRQIISRNEIISALLDSGFGLRILSSEIRVNFRSMADSLENFAELIADIKDSSIKIIRFNYDFDNKAGFMDIKSTKGSGTEISRILMLNGFEEMKIVMENFVSYNEQLNRMKAMKIWKKILGRALTK